MKIKRFLVIAAWLGMSSAMTLQASNLVDTNKDTKVFSMDASNLILAAGRPGMYCDYDETLSAEEREKRDEEYRKRCEAEDKERERKQKEYEEATKKFGESIKNGHLENAPTVGGSIENVVYGNHTYMCKNQAQYDAVIWAANQMLTQGTESNKQYTKAIEKFKNDSEFRKNVMRQGGYSKWLKEDDPLLYELMKLNYAYSTLMYYGNSNVYSGITAKKYTEEWYKEERPIREEAEQAYGKDSAYIGIAYFTGDCTSEANVASLAFDALGYDSRVVGNKRANHDWTQVKVGETIYHFSNGAFSDPKDKGTPDTFYTSWTKGNKE